MCRKAVDVCLPALKFIPNRFVTPKMFDGLDNSVNNVTFSKDVVDLANINLNNVNPDVDEFGDDVLDAITLDFLFYKQLLYKQLY